MAEWLTYRLSDLLMFSPRAYWRLVELYNRDLWPAHALAVVAGALLLWSIARPGPRSARLCAALLALAWLWIAWGFHWQRYAQIHLAAPWFAVAFALQGVMLLGWGLRWGEAAEVGSPALRAPGWALAAAGVLAYPFVGLLFGRPLVQAEVAGLTPDPTALATSGVLLAVARGTALRSLLCAIPLAWMLVAAATHWTMAAQ